MRRVLVSAVGLALALAVPAFAQPKTLLSVREVMRHIVNPAAETYWKHTGVVDTEAGSDDRTPTAEADWKETVDAAAQVMEAGNLLMLDGRARDPNGPWMKYAQALVDAGAEGMKAAQAKDPREGLRRGRPHLQRLLRLPWPVHPAAEGFALQAWRRRRGSAPVTCRGPCVPR